MGTNIIAFYRDKLKSTWKTAFCSAFFIGLVVHLFKFANLLPNADALYNFYSSQNMVASGRWFLGIACAMSSYFDLPWVIGLLSLVFMGITAALLAEIFHMENPCLIVLTSGLLVSFPAITATMGYEFTADGYMLAMALAALSAVLSRVECMQKRCWKQLVLSGICICLSCAIYQAYISFAFVLAVCYFMVALMENRHTTKQYLRWIGVQILIYGCALAGYYLIWKLCLNVQGLAASSYQGIDNVGAMGAGDLVNAVITILTSFVRFFLEWNILDHGVTPYSVLNILFLLAFALGLFAAARKTGLFARKLHLILLLLCLASLPFGCYIWYLTSTSVFYHALMLQSMVLVYVFAAVVFDKWILPRYSNVMLVLLVAIVLNNSIAANIYYNYMAQSFEVTHAAAVEISTRIHLLDDGTIRYVAIYGGLDDWHEESYFAPEELRQLGGCKLLNKTILSPMFLSLYTDFDLSYYRENDLAYPVVENAPEIPAAQDWEFRFPLLPAAQQEALAQSDTVKNMPQWPHRDSVQVIGDTVVVKLSDPE